MERLSSRMARELLFLDRWRSRCERMRNARIAYESMERSKRSEDEDEENLSYSLYDQAMHKEDYGEDYGR